MVIEPEVGIMLRNGILVFSVPDVNTIRPGRHGVSKIYTFAALCGSLGIVWQSKELEVRNLLSSQMDDKEKCVYQSMFCSIFPASSKERPEQDPRQR